MDHANIFVVQDDHEALMIATRFLEGSGHSVVLQASSLNEAMAYIGGNLLSRCAVNVAVIDGNLTAGVVTCEEGREIATAIRQKHPEIRIIAWSQSGPSLANYGDFYTGSSLGIADIIRTKI